MANPVIGNSLFALVLALMHAPPMFALLWMQRSLRRRVVVVVEPDLATPLASGSPTAIASMAASPSRG
ncbi:MAG: hypothetical protein HOH95_00090 [Dehalococcoidia bacterium]|jgi:hypothetical protein|nr:hypothetical protein [Dehalococcoidia bacterium]